MECEQIASQIKPAERQQIIDYKLQIKNINDEMKRKLKIASEQEEIHKKKCYDLTELHDNAVRQLNSLRTSYDLVKSELKLLNENIQLTVAQQTSQVATHNVSLENENDKLRKIIDENKNAYECENKRLQGENLMYVKSAIEGNATIVELRSEATRRLATSGNKNKRPRSGSMDTDIIENQNTAILRNRPTFAEVLSRQNVQTDCIRNIRIADRANFFGIQSEILANERLKALGALNKRPNGQISIRCDNPEIAKGVDDFIIANYDDKCKSDMPRPYIPTIKITGLDTDSSAADILIEIQKQNRDVKADFDFIREFEINVTRNPYRNVITRCSIEFLKKAVSRQINLNGRVLRCYEQVTTLQCFKCYAFGHISANCKNKLTCRNCSGEHLSKECKSNFLQCANCAAQKRIATHKATSEICPIRTERINGIIDFLRSKN